MTTASRARARGMAGPLVLAIDAGTTSVRCAAYEVEGVDGRSREDDGGDSMRRVYLSEKREHAQLEPHAGWLEHDADEVFENVKLCLRDAARSAAVRGRRIACVGITNQRETILAWDAETGAAAGTAIVWSDARAERMPEAIDEATRARIRKSTGLPVSGYFSALKIKWMIDNNHGGVNALMRRGTARFGTIDSWIVHRLTAGAVHATDVTNASRTLLMDVATCAWSAELAAELGLPADVLSMLPEIRSSAEHFGAIAAGSGVADDGMIGVPITGAIGDQHAATLGQGCGPYECKTTYGTGCFMMLNTGGEIVRSNNGLITTVLWQLGKDAEVAYALEGAVAVAGSGVLWMRDKMGLFRDIPELEALANGVEDSGGVIFVPALSGGLLAPHWRGDAKGVIMGMTGSTDRRHVVRALLDAIAYQIKDVTDAMCMDCGDDGSGAPRLRAMRVDGGVSANTLLMQIQADMLGMEVNRPEDVETTVRGAALAAAIGAGLTTEVKLFHGSSAGSNADRLVFTPAIGAREREARHAMWKAAVLRSFPLT